MNPVATSFKFDTIVIIDSVPAEEDPQTGPWLRDEILTPLAGTHEIKLAYFRVEHRADLFGALARLTTTVRDAGLAPIVHFESHGLEEGIVLANSDIVPWADIKPWLTEINRACRMNLLAVMSMCHGWHLVSQLQPVEQSPVWALIGPVHETLPSRLQEAFEAFYTRLLNALDGRKAVADMNANREGTKWELRIELAELMFCKIWRRYDRELCTPEQLHEREDRVVTQIVRAAGYDLRVAIAGRPVARQWFENKAQAFEQFRRTFLMLDLFEDNASRFGITYENCIRAGEDPHEVSSSSA